MEVASVGITEKLGGAFGRQRGQLAYGGGLMEAGTKHVDDFIASLKVGEPDSYANLTVFPVFSDKAGEDGYRTLDEAIKTKKFTVTEVSDGGHVPELKVVNGLDAEVLVLDGEELVGAKQNRIVNATIIVGKGQAHPGVVRGTWPAARPEQGIQRREGTSVCGTQKEEDEGGPHQRVHGCRHHCADLLGRGPARSRKGGENAAAGPSMH